MKEYIYKSQRIKGTAIKRGKWSPQLNLSGSVIAMGSIPFDTEEEAVDFACKHGEFLVDHPASAAPEDIPVLVIHAYQSRIYEKGVYTVDKIDGLHRYRVGSMKIDEFRSYIGSELILNMTVDQAVSELETKATVTVKIEA